MSESLLGDQLVSFGGYAFTPTSTLSLKGPVTVRVPLVELPGADFALDVLGALPKKRANIALAVGYWLSASTNTSLKTALSALQTAMLQAPAGLLVTQNRSGDSSYVFTARFEAMDCPLIPENLLQVSVTLHFSVSGISAIGSSLQGGGYVGILTSESMLGGGYVGTFTTESMIGGGFVA